MEMAKYSIQYACGHEVQLNLYGPHRERERRLEEAKRMLCPECYRAERRQEDQEAGLPPLEGTPRQVAWAESIRRRLYRAWREYCEEMGFPPLLDDPQGVLESVRRLLREENQAKWWIENEARVKQAAWTIEDAKKRWAGQEEK